MEEFLALYASRKESFEKFFRSEIYSLISTGFHESLAESCLYSLQAGGKRIRPVLLLSAFFSESLNELYLRNEFFLAASVECIHTYSLIHDDLPAMDNDDYRRGILTNHKKFSDGIAILAGDALNSLGFYLTSKVETLRNDPDLHKDLLTILHTGAGGPGMVSGQIEDINLENKKSDFSEYTLHKIHTKKTGALILSSLLLGNRLRKDWESRITPMINYGEKLGLLFQITDDILDEEGTREDLGKTPGKDLTKGKLTYPSLFGMTKTKNLRDEIKNELIEISGNIEPATEIFFKKLPVYIAERKN
ncbi:MAG: polyprenyl synthetase family protein [Leptospira sp.]|nr:polyprenyl synthetase family protein [Leptospira sp.]